jgi:hypothetical protein
MAEQVQEAQRRTVNGLNFAMARDVGRAYALILYRSKIWLRGLIWDYAAW